MKNRSYVSTLSSVSVQRASSQVILLLPILAVWIATNAHAASATWDLNPSNGDWNTAANWTPPTVPNGSGDTVSFAVSNIAAVSLSSDTEVGRITFDSGASEFNIIVSPLRTLTISGDGISNNSDISENFSIVVDSVSNTGTMIFTHSATAGNMTTFTNEANATNVFAFGASTRFLETSSADHGTFINNGAATSDAFGGVTEFFAESSAANATIFNQPGLVQGAHGGTTFVLDVAHADKATFISNGANVSGADGGNTTFSHRSRADDATLIANGGVNGGGGGQIVFAEASSGAASRVELFGNGFLDLSTRFSGNGIRIGSIEGDGVVILGTEPLKVGSNSLSTLFSGVIQSFGAITKVGAGTLTLSGANTYTGGTTVTGGTIKINNRSGSGTGTGAVSVSGGTRAVGALFRARLRLGLGAGRARSSTLAKAQASRSPLPSRAS